MKINNFERKPPWKFGEKLRKNQKYEQKNWEQDYAQNFGEKEYGEIEKGSRKKETEKRKVKNYLHRRALSSGSDRWGLHRHVVSSSSRAPQHPLLENSPYLAPLSCIRPPCRCWLGRDRLRRRSCGLITPTHHTRVELIQPPRSVTIRFDPLPLASNSVLTMTCFGIRRSRVAYRRWIWIWE